MSRKSKRKKASLAQGIEKSVEKERLKIEVINENLTENDLLDFTNAFLNDLSKMPKLEKFDLLTPESAKVALTMLNERQAFLAQKLKTAGKLKNMLLKRGATKEEDLQ